MSKRLQVVMSDREYEEIRILSERSGQTMSEWVRDVLRKARRDRAVGDREVKLEAVRAATHHDLPTGDIDQVLAEIEAGRDL